MKELGDKEYQEKKQKFIKFSMNFQEVFTSNSQYLKIKNLRYYKKTEEEKEKLTGSELSLISQISRKIKKRCKDIILPEAEGRPNYILYNLEEDLESNNIYEIDIKSAYLSAAKNRKIITKKEYNKFFEYEEDAKEELRKLPIDCTGEKCIKCKKGKHVKPKNISRYICKDTGAVLKYSKDVRLISLGTLATKKEVHTYSANAKRELKLNKGRIETISTKAHQSALIKKEIVYNKDQANIFYTCALDIDKVLTQIIKEVEGVFFCWVDAIFCTKEAINKVVSFLELYSYEYRVQKHISIKYRKSGNAATVQKDNKKSPYQFNRSKHIENVCLMLDTAKDMKKELDNFDFLKNHFDKIGITKELEYISNSLDLTKEELKKALKKIGFKRPLYYALWYSSKKILNINNLQSYNLQYFCKLLNEKGLSYGDFIKVKKTVREETEYKESTLKFAIETAIFFESYDRKKQKRREGKELKSEEGKDNIGESETTKIEIQKLINEI